MIFNILHVQFQDQSEGTPHPDKGVPNIETPHSASANTPDDAPRPSTLTKYKRTHRFDGEAGGGLKIIGEMGNKVNITDTTDCQTAPTGELTATCVVQRLFPYYHTVEAFVRHIFT